MEVWDFIRERTTIIFDVIEDGHFDDDHHGFDVIEDDHEKQIEEDEDIEQMNNDLMKEFPLN